MARAPRPLALEDVGERLVLATLAAEDRDFYEHGGVDGAAVVRAVGQNLVAGRVVSGASTITQQLVKLLDGQGRPEQRTVGAKLVEAARAQNLEDAVDKAHDPRGVPEPPRLTATGSPAPRPRRGRTSAWRRGGSELGTAAHTGGAPARAVVRSIVYEHRRARRARAGSDRCSIALHRRGGCWRRRRLRTRAEAEPVVARPLVAALPQRPHFVDTLRCRRGKLARRARRCHVDARPRELQRRSSKRPSCTRMPRVGAALRRVERGACSSLDNATGEVLAYDGQRRLRRRRDSRGSVDHGARAAAARIER
jgi:hypothetical protein